MEINRKNMYRFPWSKTDNPGGWVEVTDKCNMVCPGCYRSRVAGHRELEEIRQDILDTARLTNCDTITISGGEPLLHPQIVDIVRFITGLKLKSCILTNGEKLTIELLHELKEAGLANIHIHIDKAQERPGWKQKTEEELNGLRKYYADIIYREGGVQCGFHVTVYRSNLDEIPDVLGWALKNIHKVSHLSFIAFRAVPAYDNLQYFVNGRKIEKNSLLNLAVDPHEISITSEEMFGKVSAAFPGLRPGAYLNGTVRHETNKYLIMVNVGSRSMRYGLMGPKTIELSQAFYHLFKGRYYSFLRSSNVGKKLFLLSVFDKEVRKSFGNFIIGCVKNPTRIFQKIYIQNLHFQQPGEVIEGEINLCDDCPNMMAYKGKLINHCRLDEYRLYGDALRTVRMRS